MTTDGQKYQSYLKTEHYSVSIIALNCPQMFQNLAFAFNNEDVKVTIPDDAYDLENIEEIDPNDITRIRIHRDCMYFEIFISCLL